MKDNKFSALIIPHSDAHDNEYLSPVDERVAYISGFKGSNAICIVTENEAFCWTDGRYFISCEKQLYEGWKMKKMGQDETSRQFLKGLPDNIKIAVNFSLISSSLCFSSCNLISCFLNKIFTL